MDNYLRVIDDYLRVKDAYLRVEDDYLRLCTVLKKLDSFWVKN